MCAYPLSAYVSVNAHHSVWWVTRCLSVNVSVNPCRYVSAHG